MGRKKVLLISYYLYPFYNYGGGRRFTSLIDYYKNSKIDYRVITSSFKTFEKEKILFIKDPFVKDKMIDRKESTLRSFNPLPDSMFLWSFEVFKYIKKNKDKFDRIIISSPPFSLPLILSLKLKKNDLDKFVLDVRDIYYNGTLRDYRIIFIKFIDYIFDRMIFKKFDRITTNIPQFVSLIKKRYGKGRVDLVLNSIVEENCERADLNLKEKFLLYSGKLDRYRFNRDFFEEFERTYPKLGLKIFVIGKVEERIKEYLQRKEYIKFLGEMDYDKTADYILSSEIFLIMHPFDLKDGNSIFSSKLLDGIKFKKKILYVGPESEVFKFIKKYNIGETVKKSEIYNLEERLKILIARDYTYDKKVIEMFKQPFKNSYFTEGLC
ncbi:MAG: hypothetical protein QME48_06920 [bacterium]|nr:hypothetical protein [bacterium]